MRLEEENKWPISQKDSKGSLGAIDVFLPITSTSNFFPHFFSDHLPIPFKKRLLWSYLRFQTHAATLRAFANPPPLEQVHGLLSKVHDVIQVQATFQIGSGIGTRCRMPLAVWLFEKTVGFSLEKSTNQQFEGSKQTTNM